MEQYVKGLKGFTPVTMCGLSPLASFYFNFSTSCKAGVLLLVIDRDPHCNTHRVKEEIHIRLHSNNINRDSRIESPEA